MYGVLTADISGCVAFSLPVQRRNSQGLGIPAFFRSPQRPARCAAARWSGSSPDGGRSLVTTAFPGRFWQRRDSLPGPL